MLGHAIGFAFEQAVGFADLGLRLYGFAAVGYRRDVTADAR
jgi:hypothetical protein